jgi:hypothetical protein
MRLTGSTVNEGWCEIVGFVLIAQRPESDDLLLLCSVQAGARLCKALGPEFLSYLPTVMPQLLTAARLEPELKVSAEY